MFGRAHPTTPCSTPPSSSHGWVKAIGLVFLGVPVVYYTYVELFRAREIRRRRVQYHSKRQRRLERIVANEGDNVGALTSSTEEVTKREKEGSEGSEGVSVGKGRRGISEEEYEEIAEMYAPYVLGGRYCNALGPEWREQGAWEWIAWKLIWAPLHGTLFWNAGVPTDPIKLAESLPLERPNFELLFGFDPEQVSVDTAPPEPTAKETSDARLAESIGDLSASWDRLSSSTPASLSSATSQRVSRSNSETPPRVEVGEDLTATWIGQSTTFFQLDGVSVLTDPVFAHRTVDTVLAPPRLCPPPCPLSALLSIQLVLVSHDHFDHVHPDDVRYLGNSVHWVVPTGMGKFLRSLGVTRFSELTWWQTTVLEFTVPLRGGRTESRKLNITATPAQHWSSRGPLDTNQSLWCSYVVEGKHETVFHAGDTGYNATLFKAIGKVFGPFDLALLPIGSYTPRWHMISQHCNPEDAVKICLDLGAKKAWAQHWGTWILSDEHYLEPPKMLELARKKWDFQEGRFEVVRPGRTGCWKRVESKEGEDEDEDEEK
ncbi:hypothetical protein MVLG_02206 [Microbotryum lychnidis-dioicae p1A1 Lamole]|uniref:Metallo-beta-lactamase domain-containing protein n=1 Tax=Microbotryum lychnidis-dioicae (strain p1A1 Lamole / MvSl-1064) TaxID=683840 RepID=U5H4G6_USTV1|nr:hypothetical protein MVLG_02206 [Microbotryum lychnidis-dioicae p1A1 Lamole]|eukprot:KDE07535.1 hypothetical protein MVLG_02206 [Microbotryum lychnidis-dioicae p1A1 Lamole]